MIKLHNGNANVYKIFKIITTKLLNNKYCIAKKRVLIF